MTWPCLFGVLIIEVLKEVSQGSGRSPVVYLSVIQNMRYINNRILVLCCRLIPFDPSQEMIVDQGSSDAPSVAGDVSM